MHGRIGAAFWAVVAATGVVLLIAAVRVPLLDPDEARFARTSVEMLRAADPVVPQFEGQPRLVKPPLIHWVQSFFFRILGIAEWTARLPSMLAALGALLLVGWVAARHWGDEAAVWAATLLATSPLFAAAAFLGTTDALLAVHVFAVIALDLTIPAERRGSLPYVIGALLGLAFLVKGPVGVVVPLLVMLAGRTVSGREPLLTVGGVLRGAALGCAVVLPWGLAFVERVGLSEVVGILRGEALERYFAGTAHVEPPWFYLQVMLVGFLPWFIPLIAGLLRVVRERKQATTHTAIYIASGLLAGLVFFSLGKSKLPTYILPLAPLVALLATWELGRELESPGPRRRISLALAAMSALLAVGLGAVALVRPAPETRTIAEAGAVMYAAGAIVALRAGLRRQLRTAWGAVALAGGMFLTTALWILVPTLSQTRTSAWLIRAVPALEGRPVAVVDMKVPSLTFYLDRVPEQIDMAHLPERFDENPARLLVFDEADLAAVPADLLPRLREIGRQGKYVVFETLPR